MAIHKSFGIARSTLDDWIKLREQQGHLAPAARRPRIGHGFFNAALFEAFALQHSHQTLGQMRLLWHQEQGQLLSEKTFSTWMQKIGWTRKKRVGYTPSEMRRSGASS